MSATKASLSALIESEMDNEFGTPDEPARRKKFSDSMAQAIVTEIAKATITLVLNDIPINPGTFLDSLGQPITGVGASQAVTLNLKIT